MMNDTAKSTQIILTAQPASGNLVLDEIRAAIPGARLRRWLAPGVGWVELGVGRAKFKLLEAVEVFGLTWPAGGAGLDLGASPGGWTRILRQHALRVVAVDPADLDARLAADPAVSHARQTAQSYLPKSHEQFEVILNDMRLDAQDSARLMLLAAKNLRAGGWAVVKLKLPQRGLGQTASLAIEKFRAGYKVIGARQLFHNRNEITVVLSH